MLRDAGRMPLDYGSLRKIEGVPELRRSQPGNGSKRLLILVKLRKGSVVPDYVAWRGEAAPGFFTAIVADEELLRLGTDPAVASISISRSLPAVD
jgi:hypothetical protein